MIGELLREFREHKNLSQGDIEQRTGSLRCYISRVENGHTIPAIETPEKFCHALDIPLCQLFYENGRTGSEDLSASSAKMWGARGSHDRLLTQFRSALGRVTERDRELLLGLARRMAERKQSD